jgi:hypothetical protein
MTKTRNEICKKKIGQKQSTACVLCGSPVCHPITNQPYKPHPGTLPPFFRPNFFFRSRICRLIRHRPILITPAPAPLLARPFRLAADRRCAITVCASPAGSYPIPDFAGSPPPRSCSRYHLSVAFYTSVCFSPLAGDLCRGAFGVSRCFIRKTGPSIQILRWRLRCLLPN